MKLLKRIVISLLATSFVIPSSILVSNASSVNGYPLAHFEDHNDKQIAISTYSSNNNSGAQFATTTCTPKYTTDSIYVHLTRVKDNDANTNKIKISTRKREKNGYSTMGADTPSPRGWYEERYRTIYTNNEYLLYNYVLESAAYSQHIYDYNWGLFNTYETLNGQSSQYYYAYAGLSFKFSQKSRGNEVTGCWSPDSVATSSTISTWGTFE